MTIYAVMRDKTIIGAFDTPEIAESHCVDNRFAVVPLLINGPVAGDPHSFPYWRPNCSRPENLRTPNNS